MRLRISTVDHEPDDLAAQLPLRVDLLRPVQYNERPGCWLGKLVSPIRWNDAGRDHFIDHVVVWPRWVGTRIEPRCRFLPVGIAYVVDPDAIDEGEIDAAKCKYVAIGMADDSRSGWRALLPGLRR